MVPSPLTLSFSLTLTQRISVECLIELADVIWWFVYLSIRQSHRETYINYYRFVDVAEITVLKSNLSVEDLEN